MSLLGRIARRLGMIETPPQDPMNDAEYVLVQFMKQHGTTVVFDIGAHEGRYARTLRERGYTGKIVSFEPLSDAFWVLQGFAEGDDKWTCVKAAVGAEPGSAEINISGYSESSSLLPMLKSHTDAAPDTAYVGKEQVAVHSIDEVWSQYVGPTDKVFLKIDAQGFTEPILAGAAESLSKVTGMLVEMSLVQLYEGEVLAGALGHRLEELGFRCWFVQNEFADAKTKRQLQVNGTYYRD